MSKQVPEGCYRWVVWFAQGVDDSDWHYTSVSIRLPWNRPNGISDWEIRWGRYK